MFLRNMRNLFFVMAPLMLFVFIYSNFIQKPKDPITYVGAGDPDMERARAEGRATLPTFLEHLKNPAPDESHFLVKFRLDRKQVLGGAQRGAFAGPDEEPDEFIWANRLNVTAEGSTVLGFIDDRPRAKGFHSGQPVAIPLDDVVDWGYSKGGVMQGNFTTKVLLAKLPPREAEQAKRAMGWR